MKGLFQCPPWARSFWAFSPYLNHMRKFCYVYFYRVVFLKSDGFMPVWLLNLAEK